MSRKDERDRGPASRPSPKRGAIPSPREAIEKAKPYVPPEDEGDASAPQPGPAAGREHEQPRGGDPQRKTK